MPLLLSILGYLHRRFAEASGGYSTALVFRFGIIQFWEPPGWLNSGFRSASLERKGKPAGKKRPYAQV